MPNRYILAGPNGAGKTTAAYTLLPDVLGVVEFVNADEIARGLSPFNAESIAFEAGRLMLQRIDQLLVKQTDFAFETTLSTRSYVHTIKRARQAGYSVSLYYFWLPSVDVSKERVARRVIQGGHNIPPDIIERRYSRSMKNLVRLYLPICTSFTVFDNSDVIPQQIASGGIHIEIEVFIDNIWNRIVAYGNERN